MDTKARPYIHSLSTRDPPQRKGHIQTESEGLEKNISPNGDEKEVGVAILISDKIENKGCERRQRRTLHNDQRINPIRRHNNYKYICTKHRSTAICKANAN